HTIRNYYMTDTVVDQEEFIELSLPYVGLFGCAAALTDAPAQIYNLNLENFTITARAYGDGDQMFAAGAFVGYGMGVNIVGCSASGTIIGDADYGYYSYMGGIIGVQQSVYQSQTVRHYSEVRSCVSDVRVSAQSGYVFAAGGITGNLITYESHTPAYVVNSYATGDVGGAIHAGGVVGYASEGTAIENCYATGDVEAQNKIGVTIGYEAESRAFAGGIVGYCEENSVVAHCFYPRTSTVYAYARAGRDYAFADPVCGGRDPSGTKSVDSEAAVLIENRTDVTAGTPASYIRSWLKWSDADWILTDDAYPTVNHADSHTTITVTIERQNAVSDKTVTSGTLQDRYVPMSHWYLERNGVSEYVTYDGKRSFGYYFDNALTQKVPDCYIPMSDVTLYAGFADYNKVAGTYYLVAERGGAVSVRLNADGTMVYRDGALNQTSAYVYDGNRLYLYDTCFFYLREDLTEDEIAYTTFLGTVNADGSLTLSDLTYFPAETPLVAVKEIAFGYGEYYGASSEYAFYRDGTGEKDGTAFTYTLNGTVLTVRIGGATLTGAYGSDGTITIGGETLTKYDAFRGTWEKSATSYRSYTFDGKGNWTSRSYATENGIVTERTQSGTYTAYEDTITLNDGTIVGFKDGFLQVKGTDGLVQTYYRESSFAGAWRFHNASNPIVATLNGIGTDGFGTAVLDYNNGNYTVELTYETGAVQGARAICFYLYDSFYGTLVYNSETRVLSGELYSPVKQAFVAADFCVYDDFYGVWVSEIEGIDTIEFNGLGLYNLPGSQTSMPVRGTVKINGQAVGSYA
ncbi:MAG: GLUG motif-containing protein, partial [Candidatus Gallimonas sp.]